MSLCFFVKPTSDVSSVYTSLPFGHTASDLSFVFLCMMNYSDNRVITVSTLIQSQSWMPLIHTVQLSSSRMENNQEMFKLLQSCQFQDLTLIFEALSDVFSPPAGNWGVAKTLIMQYALMHKWLEHLTHTNIHISPEEDIPQGWDGAICEGKNTTTASEGKKNLQICLNTEETSEWPKRWWRPGWR